MNGAGPDVVSGCACIALFEFRRGKFKRSEEKFLNRHGTSKFLIVIWFITPDYTSMIVSLLADWKTALEYLQNRLDQVTNISLAWEELYILKDRQITRESANQILDQVQRKIKEVHNRECQMIINSVPGGANPNSNFPNFVYVLC